MKHIFISAAVLSAALPVAAIQANPFDERAVPPPPEIALSGTLAKTDLDELSAYGEVLFSARFTTLDGAGRPMATQSIIPTKRRQPPEDMFFRTAGLDSGSCAGCHNVPRAGGAGDFVTNVFVSEGFESADFDNVDPQFSNERGTNHLFGAGLIELLAREMTAELHAQRTAALKRSHASGQPVEAVLTAKGVEFGRIVAHPDGILDLSRIDGVDTDLVIRPFSQKGVMTSLRQFTVNALNHHHGMQAAERFGNRWTGEADYDEDGHADELDVTQISAMTAWQATLAPPVQLAPEDESWRQAAEQGAEVFSQARCSSCHVPALPLTSLGFHDPGPYDAAGTLRAAEVEIAATYDLAQLDWAGRLERNEKGEIMVPLFGDLKRHVIADQQVAHFGNELLPQRFVDRNIFQTTELWGLASTGPYGHRNDLTTIDEAIRAHGGEARKARDLYVDLPEEDRRALIAYLKTLVIE